MRRDRALAHTDACWDGCDDLHEQECQDCGLTTCDGDCRDENGPAMRAMREHERRGQP